MAAMPAIGVLLGSRLTGPMAALLGVPRALFFSLLACALSLAILSLLPFYPLWLLLRLLIGMTLTVVFVLGESWINQLVEERMRGRLVAIYGTGFALSQLSGPLLLAALGTADDRGFWVSVALLVLGSLLMVGQSGAPKIDRHGVSGSGVGEFCREQPTIAWAVVLFAAFEAMVLTLMPVYMLREGFDQDRALLMVSVVVVGDAVLQLPIGLLADRMSRALLLRLCGIILLCSSLALPVFLHSPLVWPLLLLFGASAGGLYTLSLIMVGQHYRDAALVRANAHMALLWGLGCLLGPLSTGAASQWLSGHALPLLMALGAAGFVVLVLRRPPFATPGQA
jgi:MFS family permease